MVDRELDLERRAEADDRRAVAGMAPRRTVPLLADVKVKRIIGRVRRLSAAVAKEILRIATCDVDAEIAPSLVQDMQADPDCR